MDSSGTVELSQAQMVAAVVAFFLPLAIDVILKSGWSERAQAVIAFLVYVVVAIVTVYFDGRWNPANATMTLLLVLTVAISAYKAAWRPTGVSPWVKTNVNG